jgi:glyoxylase-like metal-dependent hydrolase (beta-lactamase superfamily II)
MMKPVSLLPLLSLLLILATYASADTTNNRYIANEVFRSPDQTSSVESLGNGVFLFRWHPGLYVSPFLVSKDGVLAVDPINRDVAKLYREGIAAVTDAPVTKIVYSHDHRDHIVGADVLGPNADLYAHPGTLATIKARGDTDIPAPTILIDDGDQIKIGTRSVGVHYFGPNHGDSNIALSFTTNAGMMLVWVDTIEIGIAPYRSLPDTNFNGYLHSLEKAIALESDWVLGGHSGPGSSVWLENFRDYFLDMRDALSKADAEIEKPPGEYSIAASEKYISAVVEHAVNQLRPKYGHWLGFEEWARMNAQTIRMAINIGK